MHAYPIQNPGLIEHIYILGDANIVDWNISNISSNASNWILSHKMTPWKEYTIRITGSLSSESPIIVGFPVYGPVRQVFHGFMVLITSKLWINSRVSDKMKRLDGHATSTLFPCL